MMTPLQTQFINCLTAALRDKTIPLTQPDQAEALFALASEHGLFAMVYDAVPTDSLSAQTQAKWAPRYMQAVLYGLLQAQAAANVEQALKRGGIIYLPMKGIPLKALYPQPHYRMMSDLDYYIPNMELCRLKSIMKTLCFVRDERYTESDIGFTNAQGLHVELHRALFNAGFAFKEAQLYLYASMAANGSVLRWTHEQEYLYLVLHAARHILIAGIGVRVVLDLYLYRKRYAPDMPNIASLLSQYGLAGFHNRLQGLGEQWFGQPARPDASLDDLASLVLCSGLFGSQQLEIEQRHSHAGETRRRNARLSAGQAVPPLRTHGGAFPLPKPFPFLLPFLWGFRILTQGFAHRHRLLAEDAFCLRRLKRRYQTMSGSFYPRKHLETPPCHPPQRPGAYFHRMATRPLGFCLNRQTF